MMNVSDFESEDYSEVSSLADEIELIVDNQYAGLRLDACLAKMLPEYSRSRITDCIKKGFVSIDNKVASPKTKVVGGEKIIFRLPEKVETANFAPENIPLNIIYEVAKEITQMSRLIVAHHLPHHGLTVLVVMP